VAARSWRYLAGLLLGAAAWIGVSLFVAGPQAMVALGRLIAQSYPAQAGNSVGLPSLVSALTGSGALGFVAAAGLGLLASAMLLWKRDLLRDQPVAAVALGIVLSLLCAPHVNAEDLMLVALPLALLARTRPLLALGESLAFSLAALVQLQLPVGDRHLEPFVLVVLAVSLVLTHVAPHRDAAANTERVSPTGWAIGADGEIRTPGQPLTRRLLEFQDV
jgi:hypothetical protein